MDKAGLGVSVQPASLIIALAMLFVISGLPSYADDIPPCSTPPGVESVQIPDGVPVALQQSLRKSFGEIALPGQSFNATDVVTETRPARRFIFVWHFGDQWIVATEHGGIGYNDPVFLFRTDHAHENPQLLRTEIAVPNTVCLIAGHMAQQ